MFLSLYKDVFLWLGTATTKESPKGHGIASFWGQVDPQPQAPRVPPSHQALPLDPDPSGP